MIRLLSLMCVFFSCVFSAVMQATPIEKTVTFDGTREAAKILIKTNQPSQVVAILPLGTTEWILAVPTNPAQSKSANEFYLKDTVNLIETREFRVSAWNSEGNLRTETTFKVTGDELSFQKVNSRLSTSLLDAVNKYRAKYKLPPFKHNPSLYNISSTNDAWGGGHSYTNGHPQIWAGNNTIEDSMNNWMGWKYYYSHGVHLLGSYREAGVHCGINGCTITFENEGLKPYQGQ